MTSFSYFWILGFVYFVIRSTLMLSPGYDVIFIFRPSVGLTSLRGFLEAFISSTKLTNGTSNYTFEWNCIFLPDNGAFFVNYVVTSAIIGTALELMRFSELLSKSFLLVLQGISIVNYTLQFLQVLTCSW